MSTQPTKLRGWGFQEDSPTDGAPSASRSPTCPAATSLSLAESTPKGIVAVFPGEHARALGWQTAGFPSTERSGAYVHIQRIGLSVHRYLEIPRLPVEFHAPSRALSLAEEELSNNGVEARDTLSLPDIDRVLAKARPNALAFCETVMYLPQSLARLRGCPVHTILAGHFARLQAEEAWASTTAGQRAVHLMDGLLTVVLGPGARAASTLWLGCPAVPDKFWDAIFAQVARTHPTWIPPPQSLLSTVLSRIDEAAQEAQLLS